MTVEEQDTAISAALEVGRERAFYGLTDSGGSDLLKTGATIDEYSHYVLNQPEFRKAMTADEKKYWLGKAQELFYFSDFDPRVAAFIEGWDEFMSRERMSR
jgi:hypothetical protein